MKNYFVVSDIHSFYDEFIHALNKSGFKVDNQDHILVVCGDVFDRGPKSIELLHFLQELPKERFIYVRGNHEDLLEDCYYEVVSGHTVSSHHYSNGTVRTIADLSGLEEYAVIAPRRSESVMRQIRDNVLPVLDWIDSVSVNYAEIGDYIFVHGWIPTDCDGIDCFGRERNPRATPMEHWDNVPALWKQARWSNGMEMWKKGVKIPGKTIVCGHFHSSWGHSHLHQDRKEFPPKNQKDWQKSFEPFIEDGIIALDACTVYSGFVNVLKIEV